MKKLKILKFERNEFEIRLSINKITAIRDYFEFKNEKELLRFCYMLSFLRTIISSKANLCVIMKKVIVKEVITYIINDKKRINKSIVKFR